MIGNTLNGRYKIVEKVGEGGMATIYRAQDLRLRRDVAIKVLHEKLAQESEVLSRFVREAQSAAKLVHPNIVNVFDIEEFDGINYIVMEYVDAKSLKEAIVRRAPFDFETVHLVFDQIVKAVKYAHENGIIHRDLKPQNVLLAEGKIVKVTDFGIARALTSSSLTQTGTMMGSVQYFSPEQAQGKPVDKTADIYSLGIMLFECLTGKLPFDGDNPVSVALKQVQDDPPVPSRFNSDIPENLDEVVLKALRKNPAERYQDVDEFYEALEEVLVECRGTGSLRSSESSGVDGGTLLMRSSPVIPSGSSGRQAVSTRDEKEDYEAVESRGGGIVFVMVLLLFLVVVTAFFVERGLLFQGFRKDAVPDLEGLALERARSIADQKGWQISIDEEIFNSKVPEGVIITQNPKGGDELPRGGTIRVVISRGKPRAEIPDLTGMSVDRAMQELNRLGLKGTVEKTVFSDRYEKDIIVSQDPGPSDVVSPGIMVRLVVSKGTERIEVPGVVGSKVVDARKLVVSKGLKFQVSEERESSMYPEGTIISQKPVPGGMVNKGSSVEVVVAKASARDLVKTPNLTGKTISEARNFLEPMGITLQVTEGSSEESMQIQGQDPAPGQLLPGSKTIKIWTLQWIVVPGLQGRTLEEAQSSISRSDLMMGDVKYIVREGVVEGVVLDQNPREGMEVEKGTRVDLVVSGKHAGSSPGSGETPVVNPSVKGSATPGEM